LSSPLDDAGHYAWAPDLPLGEGTITAITFADGDLKVIGVQGVGVHTELDGPDLSQPAWLETARIRFGTVEDKHFAYAQVRGAFDPANVLRVEAMTAGGEWATIANPAVPGAVLHQGTSSGVGGAAVPAGRRRAAGLLPAASPARRPPSAAHLLPGGRGRHQQTRSGLEAGYEGWALDRLAADRDAGAGRRRGHHHRTRTVPGRHARRHRATVLRADRRPGGPGEWHGWRPPDRCEDNLVSALSPPVLAAFITGGCALVATLLGLVVPALLKHGRVMETVRAQVQNDHGSNLRDDLDLIRDLVLDVKADTAWVRRDHIDLVKRVDQLEKKEAA
jgi:hypothetical protein